MSDENNKQKELRNKMEKFLGRAKTAITRGREEVVKVSKIGKLKFEMSSMQRQRQRLMLVLADKVVRLVKEGNLSAAALADEVNNIDLLHHQIAEMEREIKGLSSGIHEAVRPTSKPFNRPSSGDDEQDD